MARIASPKKYREIELSNSPTEISVSPRSPSLKKTMPSSNEDIE